MATRVEIRDILASSQAQVVAYFEGLSPQDLECPATENELPGVSPWRAKDHLAHLTQSERNIQRLLRRVLAGDSRDALLRLQYPEGMPLPSVLGDWDALTAEEQEQLVSAVANLNQTYLNAHADDTLEALVAEYRAARQDTVDLIRQFSDEQLAAPLPLVTGEQSAADLFAGRAGHAVEHMTAVEQGLRQRG